MGCLHPEFSADVDIRRIANVEDGPIVGYMAEMRIECAVCHEPFCFRGPPPGLSHLAPTASLDGTLLYAPIHPISDPTAGIGLLGFSVKITLPEGDTP